MRLFLISAAMATIIAAGCGGADDSNDLSGMDSGQQDSFPDEGGGEIPVTDIGGNDLVDPDQGGVDDVSTDAADAGAQPDLTPFPDGATARRIESPDDLVTGPMSSGTIGDILLSNKHVRFVIRDQQIGLYSPSAGSIVDADVTRDPGDGGHEKFLELFPMIGFGRVLMADKVEIIDDGTFSGTARVRISGRDHGMPIIDMLVPTFPFNLQAVMDYVLEPDAGELRIELAVTNGAKYEQDVEIGTVVQFGRRLEYFYHQCGRDKSCLIGRDDVEWMAAGSDDVSYAFTTAPGTGMSVVLAEEQLLLTRTAKTSLAPDATTSSVQYLIVGSGTIDEVSTRASDIRQTATLRTVTGKILLTDSISDVRDARVFARKQGASGKLGWMAAGQPDEEGNVTIHLPDGVWDLTTTLPGSGDVTSAVAVAEKDDNTFEIHAVAAGRLHVTINDGDGGLLPAAVFIKNGLDMPPAAGGEFHAVRGGDDNFMLLPGEYTVMAMKGLEYGLVSANATVLAGAPTHVMLSLHREVETPGQVTVVSHAHAENSIDSYVPMNDRVHNALAAGIDFPMITEHDFFSNLQPFIESEGYQDRLKSTVGIEISPLGFHTVGLNCSAPPSYPTYFAIRFGDYDSDGYLSNQYTPGQIVEKTRGFGCQYVGAAHPWEGSAMFNYIGMGPEDDPADFAHLLDLHDLDGMELINSDDNWSDLDTLHLPAWFRMLGLGYRITAVGGSDEHGYSIRYGHPLNLVQASSDNAADLEPTDVFEAIREGRTILYGGPYIDLDMGGFGVGDVVDMSVAEPPVLRIRLDAPSWMTIDFVRIYVGGVLVNEFVLTPEMAAGDWLLDTTFEPEITGDSYIVVAAGSSREEARMPGYGRFPVTVANPIWLDSDGNGWEAPISE
ncbi:MAG TPA: CehA/McbA family metallohydrolase [Myxococcota bacterium]|nr:CehA/McbA family metallohydrolase [Myxococcota bacterium]